MQQLRLFRTVSRYRSCPQVHECVCVRVRVCVCVCVRVCVTCMCMCVCVCVCVCVFKACSRARALTSLQVCVGVCTCASMCVCVLMCPDVLCMWLGDDETSGTVEYFAWQQSKLVSPVLIFNLSVVWNKKNSRVSPNWARSIICVVEATILIALQVHHEWSVTGWAFSVSTFRFQRKNTWRTPRYPRTPPTLSSTYARAHTHKATTYHINMRQAQASALIKCYNVESDGKIDWCCFIHTSKTIRWCQKNLA